MVHARSRSVRSLSLVAALSLQLFLVASCGGDSDPVSPPANHAPAVPSVGTGGPADGAVDVALDAVLSWSCTDSDGDPLTYDVHFGATSDPAVASAGQSATTYAPTLVHTSIYYWKIVASDDVEESTSSPVWSFTTVAAAGETIGTPNQPAGPAAVTAGSSTLYGTSGATSSEGHGLEHRFDWGDGSVSTWALGPGANHAWTTAGSYDVTAQARCAADTDVVSAWSTALSVTVSEPSAEIVTRPGTPTGPAHVETGASSSYTTSGAVSTLQHSVEYRYDGDDGTTSAWRSSTGEQHIWSAAGSYDVTVMARCVDHPEVESVWSLPLSVTVRAPETVSAPDPADGPLSAEIQTALTYVFSGAASSWGHAVEYRVDWDDGQVSGWTTATSYQHTWTTVGTYDVLVQARCVDHPEIESGWSAATTVTITEPAETVAPPVIANPSESAGVGDDTELRCYNGGSNLGHAVEARYDWGDGSFSTWSTSVAGYYYNTHAWTTAGTYDVRAQLRCIEHPEAVSGWSVAATIEVTDTEILTPPVLSSAAELDFNLGGTFTSYLSGAASNMGHVLEYQVEWGDGTMIDWTTRNDASKTWTVEGDFTARARIRCQEHPDVISGWSTTTIFHVVEVETINGIGTLTGPTTATVGVPNAYTVSGFTSSMGHDLEYQLYDGYNESVPGVGQGWVSADNLAMTWDATGMRVLTVGARCIAHPEIINTTSYRVWVTISD